jgi:hypothetical protein
MAPEITNVGRRSRLLSLLLGRVDRFLDRLNQMTGHFRLYVFDRDNRIVRSLDMIAPDKAAATKLARVMLRADSDVHAYELWQNARRVQKEHSPAWTLTTKGRRIAQQRRRAKALAS